MTAAQWRAISGRYVDSVRLMQVARQARELDGVTWTTAVMGTAANLDELREAGFTDPDLDHVEPNQVVVAAKAESDEQADRALDEAAAAIEAGDQGGDGGALQELTVAPRTQAEAADQLPEALLTMVSVPGAYAALEAHKALTAGRHVLIFSDQVPVGDEVTLKQRGAASGLLVMGPDAGTAAIGGVGLGFANVVPRGPVGVVAAAGTGAQEIMSLMGRWGSGVSHVLGLGGRDLSQDVGGIMAREAIARLREDERTEVVVVVSKPPASEVATKLLEELTGVPAVVAFLGLAEADELSPPDGVTVTATLEGAALGALDQLGLRRPDLSGGLRTAAAEAADRIPDRRRSLRGLFTGGTLCYESMLLASQHLGPVHSNTPLRPEWGLPAPDGAHVCLDLGEDEYTQGRPHPMIDPDARIEHVEAAGDDPSTAVVLLDVVLGQSAHMDPAGAIAPVCRRLLDRPDGPVVVASVLGTDDDPQDRAAQCARLEDAGCLLAPTAARAARLATAIIERRPETAEEAA